MQYHITHTTLYTYSHAVLLQPHLLRLRPRSDGWQTLEQFELTIFPEPLAQSPITDLDGNATIKLWFAPEPSHHLKIITTSQVTTHLDNPFIYLLEPWVLQLPMDYPSALAAQLQPYWLNPPGSPAIDPAVVQLAQEVLLASDGAVIEFLTLLNQRIYQECHYQIRETGHAYPPGITWREKKGSCRDFTLLFIATCRAIGLAARFVSGYQEGDVDTEDRSLHAWAEVYLPGAGWRGYDPTHGLLVSDRHIALAASPDPRSTLPIEGQVKNFGNTAIHQVQTTLTHDLQLTIQT
ncbi:MAG: transglutaminase family protein [Synechococcales bacterium]|nr:transglutaminase family protein [Synechococcales bacterium]